MTEEFFEELPQVAASEKDLLDMAQAVIAPHATDVWGVMCRTRKLPPHVSETFEWLLGDTLSKVWHALWRRGGTEPGASLDNGNVKRGRIWQRHPVTPLEFSPATLRLLRWLVQTQFPVDTTKLPAEPLTIGDQVMLYLALGAAHGTPAFATLATQPLVRAAPLAWLGFFDSIPGAPPAFDSLVEGAGAIVVEALSGELARHWQTVELEKRIMESPDALIDLGQKQDAVVRGFMTACDKVKRRDLALFLVDAAAVALARNLSPMPAQLDPTTTMSARAQARIAAGALLRAVTAWAEWDRQHRGVRFIDDDYAAAQYLLGRFERIQSAGVDRANAWLSELSSLAPTSGSPGPGSAATVEAP